MNDIVESLLTHFTRFVFLSLIFTSACSPQIVHQSHSVCTSDTISSSDDTIVPLITDINGDSELDIIVKKITPKNVIVYFLLGSDFSVSASLTFLTGNSMEEQAFCDTTITMSLTEQKNKESTIPIIQLSDGLCDSFYIEWDTSQNKPIWSRGAID